MNYHSNFDSDLYQEFNNNSFNNHNQEFYKNNNQRCCIRYTQEICCYPSYYHDCTYEEKKCDCNNNFNDKKYCCKQKNHYNIEKKKECSHQNKTHCFCRLFNC